MGRVATREITSCRQGTPSGRTQGKGVLLPLRMARCTALWLLAGALFLAACAIVRSDFKTATVASLQDYATLLREMNLNAEAEEMAAQARKLRQAFQSAPGTPLGFDPSATLNEYAAVLRKLGREADAKETEALANAYHRANVETQKLVFQRSQAGKLLGDRLIVPGERIGRLQLEGKLDEVTKSIGPAMPRGAGFREGTTTYTWDPIGLWLIADNAAGNIIWISVEVGENPWGGLATREGLRLGSTEEQVLAAMGKPARTVSDGFAKSFYFDRQGIRFTLPITGPMAGKVAALRVVRPGTQP